MGDIPDCALFRDPVLEKYLQPYFEIIEGMTITYSFLEAFESRIQVTVV
jgi:hypothetical protein